LSPDLDEIFECIFVILRVIAFFSGLGLMLWGFATMGNTSSDALQALFSGVSSPVAVVVGLILIILAIVPSAIKANISARL